MDDRREMQAALAWLELPYLGERTLLALQDHARESRRTLADLWQAMPEDLAAIVPLHPRALAAWRERKEEVWTGAGAEVEDALTRGAELWLLGHPDYPGSLLPTSSKARRWPYLFSYGAASLLEEPRVAVVSSRSVSPHGLAVTDALADALARRDITLATSTNRESYQAAATAAKRHAGPAIMVLDRGIASTTSASLEREPVASARVWDERFDPELQLLLSPFTWRCGWTARNGPRRDSLLFDLANVIVAVEVAEGGNIDRECRDAVERGHTVFALDLGNTLGTRGLWDTGGARRLKWGSAEDVANEVSAALPTTQIESSVERQRRAWLAEVHQFLCRLSATASHDRRPLVYPDGSALRAITEAWGRHPSDGTGQAASVVADLWSTQCPPARITQLSARLLPEGLLAALIPAAWLTEDRYAAIRSAWLDDVMLRCAVSLPAPHASEHYDAAVIVLQRSSRGSCPAATFAPDRSTMGRFHLRRYLREVAASFTLPLSSG